MHLSTKESLASYSNPLCDCNRIMIDSVTHGRVSENRDSPVRLRSSFTERLSSEANSSANYYPTTTNIFSALIVLLSYCQLSSNFMRLIDDFPTSHLRVRFHTSH
jgi:hypothetical protein